MHVRIVFSLPELGDFKRRVLLVLSVRTRLLTQKKGVWKHTWGRTNNLVYVFLENKAFRAACFFVTLPIPRKGNWLGLYSRVLQRWFTPQSLRLSSHCVCGGGHGGPLATGRVRTNATRVGQKRGKRWRGGAHFNAQRKINKNLFLFFLLQLVLLHLLRRSPVLEPCYC